MHGQRHQQCQVSKGRHTRICERYVGMLTTLRWPAGAGSGVMFRSRRHCTPEKSVEGSAGGLIRQQVLSVLGALEQAGRLLARLLVRVVLQRQFSVRLRGWRRQERRVTTQQAGMGQAFNAAREGALQSTICMGTCDYSDEPNHCAVLRRRQNSADASRRARSRCTD